MKTLIRQLLKEHFDDRTAVIEIKIPIRYMDIDNYYQAVPYHATQNRMIYIKKGAAGHKSISTKNIEVLKVFDNNDVEGIQNYLDFLRNK
jgi:hypothetical protein